MCCASVWALRVLLSALQMHVYYYNNMWQSPWLSLTDRTSYIKAPTGIGYRGKMANDCIRGFIIIFLFWTGIKPKLAACFHWITAQNIGSLGYNARQCIVLYWQSRAYLSSQKMYCTDRVLHYADILHTQIVALCCDIAQTEMLHYTDSLQNVVHQRKHVAKTAPCIILTITGHSFFLCFSTVNWTVREVTF